MTAKFNPITVTPTFYQLGTPFFPMYLSIGKDAMLIEGGISATFDIVVEQIALLGIAPERIKYIALTHTHTDHIGALPRFKALWPHLKSIGSPLAAKILSGDNLLTSFKGDDSNISKIMQAKEEIQEIPPDLAEYNFKVDIIANDQDRFDLGNGVVWTAHAIPGHSACQIAYYEEKEGNLAIGDATGFYNPEEDVFWPNYFNSLSKYSDSIKKLARFQAQRIALSHNGIIVGDVNIYAFFERALKAAGAYHQEMLEHIEKGADPEAIALEKAKWVHSIADHMPFNIMPVLCRLMIKLSQKEIGNGGLNFQL
jgi:glyoxylase-like metal-dependent hydrolase (beta-lactamase superfamily II)